METNIQLLQNLLEEMENPTGTKKQYNDFFNEIAVCIPGDVTLPKVFRDQLQVYYEAHLKAGNALKANKDLIEIAKQIIDSINDNTDDKLNDVEQKNLLFKSNVQDDNQKMHDLMQRMDGNVRHLVNEFKKYDSKSSSPSSSPAPAPSSRVNPPALPSGVKPPPPPRGGSGHIGGANGWRKDAIKFIKSLIMYLLTLNNTNDKPTDYEYEIKSNGLILVTNKNTGKQYEVKTSDQYDVKICNDDYDCGFDILIIALKKYCEKFNEYFNTNYTNESENIKDWEKLQTLRAIVNNTNYKFNIEVKSHLLIPHAYLILKTLYFPLEKTEDIVLDTSFLAKKINELPSPLRMIRFVYWGNFKDVIDKSISIFENNKDIITKLVKSKSPEENNKYVSLASQIFGRSSDVTSNYNAFGGDLSNLPTLSQTLASRFDSILAKLHHKKKNLAEPDRNKIYNLIDEIKMKEDELKTYYKQINDINTHFEKNKDLSKDTFNLQSAEAYNKTAELEKNLKRIVSKVEIRLGNINKIAALSQTLNDTTFKHTVNGLVKDIVSEKNEARTL